MRFPELLQPGTMLFVSWKVFHDYETETKVLLKNKTCFERPIWSPVLTCEVVSDSDKDKWKKIQIILYDVTHMRYIRWSYKLCLDRIEDGTIQLVE